MAKKGKELTLEEKLEQALVPAEEQPYEVPENWCWVHLQYICNYMRAGGDKPNELSDVKTDMYRIPIVANGLQDDGIIGYTNKECESGGTITISGRGTIGHSVYREYPYYPVVRLIVLNPNNRCVEGKYLKYIFDSFKEEGTGTSIPQLTVPMIKDKKIPLPPLAEQQRIVDRIESLFAKLDEAKEKIQNVLDESENRMNAILHKAYSSELTRIWREQNNIEDKWADCTFEEMATIKSNLVKPQDYMQYPHIAPDNIEKKTGKLLEYHTIEEDGVTSGKHRFFAGQILYSKIRPYLSKVVLVNFDGLCSADMYPIEAKENAKFLWYYMLSDRFLIQASSAGSRSVLPKINQKELCKIIMRKTGLDEQAQVVKIIESMMFNENQIVETASNAIEKIDEIKKSILAKAFRGELGTNGSSDEAAMELLKRVLGA